MEFRHAPFYFKMEEIKVYHCVKCDRYTDARYLMDKFNDRQKAYCYYCKEEHHAGILKPVIDLQEDD